jgi:hypothetical protein
MTLEMMGWIIFRPYKYWTYQKLIQHGSNEINAYSIASTITKEEYQIRYKHW